MTGTGYGVRPSALDLTRRQQEALHALACLEVDQWAEPGDLAQIWTGESDGRYFGQALRGLESRGLAERRKQPTRLPTCIGSGMVSLSYPDEWRLTDAAARTYHLIARKDPA